MIRWFLAAALSLAAPAIATPQPGEPTIAAALQASHFAGYALVAKGDRVVYQTPRATCPPPGGGTAITLCHPRDPGQLAWPWASVTKQVMAVLTMQQVAAGRITLDVPASRYFPAIGRGGIASPTVRQLLQHRAGLPNPEDSPKDSSGQPGWYGGTGSGLNWCLTGRTAPGGQWRYNNCDTIVLGALLARVTGRDVPTLFAERIARPLGLAQTRFAGRGRTDMAVAVAVTPAECALLTRYAAAGGLVGPPADLLRIDRALIAGTLLPVSARDEMWRGDPSLGYMALGQWAFSAPLKGCAAPVRMIERRGGIGRFQARNILIPDRDMVVILFVADGDLDFGEIWQGKGLSHDLLAAAVCGTPA